MRLLVPTGALILALAGFCQAHMIGDESHDAGFLRDGGPDPLESARVRLMAAASVPAASGSPSASSLIQGVFGAFPGKVRTRTDGQFLFVESDGLPDHGMMIGITAWQQQVPLPQAYTGDNAWRIPLRPVPAATPVSIKGRFLRGAIALAVNGIPIFNPQNNRGEIAQEIGELDQWGGHCGRADDYHYHAAPFHLETIVGKGKPIAYALDGYPIYGSTGPDGKPVDEKSLDALRGKVGADGQYAYYGSTKYPYVMGGFHGVVVEKEGQVDPQPRAQTVREAGAPLRGAKITGFTAKENKSFSLKYEVSGETRSINYVVNPDKSVKFDFVDGRGQLKSETYSPRQGGVGGGNRPPGEQNGSGGQKKGRRPGPEGADGNRPPGDRADARPARESGSGAAPFILSAKHSGNFVLQSSAVTNGGALPAEFTGDGAGATPPLEWKGAPVGTKSYALVMDHLAPGNDMKCYWTMWDIPGDVRSLAKNVKGVGKLGPGFKGQLGYEPPHSQGPGLKTYTLHVYALSAAPKLDRPQREVTRDVLLTAIKDLVLDSADLKVTYTRSGSGGGDGERRGPGGPGGKKKGEAAF